ncbi:MAG: hypothetical protein Q7S40_12825 [Opitutaceae bacterium]|nr:hypothetical protein [Opitutaceae bacterium]
MNTFQTILTPSRLSLTAVLPLVLLLAVSGSAAEPKQHFRADAPGAPAYTLPDPLTAANGRKITTAGEWKSGRRAEVLELFRQHVYGRVPATPYEKSFKIVNEDRNAMNGAATLKQVEITVASGGKSLVIHLSLFVPNRARGPVPAFLLICNRPPGENIDPTRAKKSEFWPAEEGIARGYAMAAFFNGDVDPDDKKDVEFKDGIHALLDRGPRAPDAWGTIAAWAWGASRCMDYLVTDAGIARDRVAVIGHSRGGKTALWAGAEDERFAIVCSNDSGCGGAALSRRKNKEKETVAVINRGFPHWFNTNFKSYNAREDALPVDQHMLIALVAPRAVCVHSAAGDLWADPRGEFLSVVHARPVYQLFGKQALGASTEMPPLNEPRHGDGAHYFIRAGKHNLTLVDWTAYWEFEDKVYSGRQ